MKHLILIIVLLSGTLSAQERATPLDAKINHLLEISGARAQFLAAIDNLVEMQRSGVAEPALPAEFWSEFSAEVHRVGWEQIQPALVRIYRDNYTPEMIDFQIAYFEDTLAQQIVSKQETVMQQSMAAGSQWGQDMGRLIAERMAAATEEKH
ncbi:DUF2059 domain-containing protein [Lewinella sp. JB7]|uniref:DUF2059 domain-containing protein n=1 Tax=Lewinella sp. JB7 TaxID=2962887 RepID=UPI0020C9F3A2|nr:DUF2059 domain-containing protein [Lewinella sp. JB7]MCP9235359.1 DUF2059 domain-containing protein [Lewinella sp. JB7]